MVTKEVIDLIKEICEVDEKKATRIYGTILRGLVKSLREEGVVKLPKMGHFILRKKNQRLGVNPRTKERILIPPNTTVFFKPSTVLKRMIKE